jgi:hypothetical protein
MRTPLRFAAIVAALGIVTAAGISGAQDERKPPQLRREVAAAAADVNKALVERMEAGEAMTPTFVELMFEWSRRTYAADAAAAATKDGRAKAAANHLDRVQALYRIIHARFLQGLDVSRVQEAQATYYLREAELWVAESQGL